MKNPRVPLLAMLIIAMSASFQASATRSGESARDSTQTPNMTGGGLAAPASTAFHSDACQTTVETRVTPCNQVRDWTLTVNPADGSSTGVVPPLLYPTSQGTVNEERVMACHDGVPTASVWVQSSGGNHCTDSHSDVYCVGPWSKTDKRTYYANCEVTRPENVTMPPGSGTASGGPYAITGVTGKTSISYTHTIPLLWNSASRRWDFVSPLTTETLGGCPVGGNTAGAVCPPNTTRQTTTNITWLRQDFSLADASDPNAECFPDGTATVCIPSRPALICDGSFSPSWNGGTPATLGNTCMAAYTANLDNTELSGVITNTSGGRTGTAKFVCINGALQQAAVGVYAATCALSCDGSQSYSWGGGSCSASETLPSPLSDGTTRTESYDGGAGAAAHTGTGYFICNNGAMQADSSMSSSCAIGCNSAVKSWTNGLAGPLLKSCSGSTGAGRDGDTVNVTSVSNPNNGSASSTCSAGTWSAPSSATCN